MVRTWLCECGNEVFTAGDKLPEMKYIWQDKHKCTFKEVVEGQQKLC